MPTTRSSAARAVAPPESDDDAPEEVTLANSKAAAEAALLEQQQQSEQATRKNRRRRQRSPAAEEEQQTEQDQQTEQQAAVDEEAIQGQGQEQAEDLLPDDVLQALANKEQGSDGYQLSAHEQGTVQGQLRKANKKRQKLNTVKKGPVTVAVLGNMNKSAPGTSSSFLRDQLYGNRVKRSQEMLKGQATATYGYANSQRILGPAAKFV